MNTSLAFLSVFSFDAFCMRSTIHEQIPPHSSIKPNAANGNRLCKNVRAPMNGAVKSQMRAQTTHENKQIFCLVVGTSSLVHVNKTACEQVVAIFEIIANVMPSDTYVVSDTIRTLCICCYFKYKKKSNVC